MDRHPLNRTKRTRGVRPAQNLRPSRKLCHSAWASICFVMRAHANCLAAPYNSCIKVDVLDSENTIKFQRFSHEIHFTHQCNHYCHSNGWHSYRIHPSRPDFPRRPSGPRSPRWKGTFEWADTSLHHSGWVLWSMHADLRLHAYCHLPIKWGAQMASTLITMATISYMSAELTAKWHSGCPSSARIAASYLRSWRTSFPVFELLACFNDTTVLGWVRLFSLSWRVRVADVLAFSRAWEIISVRRAGGSEGMHCLVVIRIEFALKGHIVAAFIGITQFLIHLKLWDVWLAPSLTIPSCYV